MRILPVGILIMLCGLCIAGCSKKDDPVVIKADKTDIQLSAEGGKNSFEINANGTWELTGIPAWLHLSPTSGTGNTKIEVSFDPNTTANEKKATINLASPGVETSTITITQAQPPVVISEWTIHAKGGEDLVIKGTGFSDAPGENQVTINGKTCEIKHASKTALTVVVPARAGEGKINIKVNKNTGVAASEFHYDWVGVVTTLNVFQEGMGIETVVDAAGNLYTIAFQSIYKLGTDNEVKHLAGSGIRGYADGTGDVASFNNPGKLAIDANGNIFVADNGNHAIRKITPAGVVSTVAGNGTEGHSDGTIAEARFSYPSAVTVDNAGNIYVTEVSRVRKIAGNTVTTFAGSNNGGDLDGTGTAAKFWGIQSICTGTDGNLFLIDHNHKLKRISAAGVVTSLAGNKTLGFVDGLGDEARFHYPNGCDADKDGNIIVSDRQNNAIRIVSKTGWVSTLAGSGEIGNADGTGPEARFDFPHDVTVMPNGNIYVGDAGNQVMRKIVLQ